jgi:hypothetical protein
MISNAMFYRQDTQATTNKAGVLMKIGPIEFTLTQLWISFIGTMIVLPVNLLIVTLFRKAKYSQRALITHQIRERKRRCKSGTNDEQNEKTNRFVVTSCSFAHTNRKSRLDIRFFSKGKYRLARSKQTSDDNPIERIAAIPSIEDKTRTFPHWTIYIAWSCKCHIEPSIIVSVRRRLVIMLSILTCAFFIILYSLEWGAKRANEWLITMLLSFGQSILVIDPIKVFFITAIISFLIRRPYDDETLDFNDPFTGTLLSNESALDGDLHAIYNDARIKGSRRADRSARCSLFRTCRYRAATSCTSLQSSSDRFQSDVARTRTTSPRNTHGRNHTRDRHLHLFHHCASLSLVSST